MRGLVAWSFGRCWHDHGIGQRLWSGPLWSQGVRGHRALHAVGLMWSGCRWGRDTIDDKRGTDQVLVKGREEKSRLVTASGLPSCSCVLLRREGVDWLRFSETYGTVTSQQLE